MATRYGIPDDCCMPWPAPFNKTDCIMLFYRVLRPAGSLVKTVGIIGALIKFL